MSQRDVDQLVGAAARQGIHMWLDLVRVPPSGTWARRRANLFGDAEEWLGPAPDLAPEECIDHLVRRGIEGFGPIAVRDVCRWAQLRTDVVQASLGRLGARWFADENGLALADLEGLPLADADQDAPVRYLPTWDAVLLSFARHGGLLPEQYRDRVFRTTMPQSIGTFTVNGVVAGTWVWDGAAVQRMEFQPLGASARRALDDEAEVLADLYGQTEE